MEEYTIGQLSKLLDINRETIRYYENLRLIPLPEKKENGYKIYTKRHVELMEVILLIRDSGFTLREVKEIIAIQEEHRDASNDIFKEILLKKVEMIDQKISDLGNLKNGLMKVVNDIENYNIRSCIEIQKQGQKK
jgi:DNA-binding transcriptional MerR regulator